MEEISIKINIADRIYPLKINIHEEENVRRAAKMINERIKQFQENYAVKDKQDLLSMCVLQFATESLKIDNKNIILDNGISSRINGIESVLTNFLSAKNVL